MPPPHRAGASGASCARALGWVLSATALGDTDRFPEPAASPGVTAGMVPPPKVTFRLVENLLELQLG